MTDRAISLRVFPHDDPSFQADATQALEAAESPVDLQRVLRVRYPAAVVRPREGIADPGFGPDVWYVYRFGSARPVIRWWTEGSHPWAILDDERCFLEVSESLAMIVEAPVAAIVGQPVEVFSNPDDVTAREDVEALWAQFRRAGQLDSTLRFRRLDGSEREIEYHLVANASGPGRHLATVREVPSSPPEARRD